ncbi:hypothetical protein GOC87_03800 [Sinorhizobium meliloti]|uniref:hypothetical protein n=1 Tax=Rhizobium meliloti TaxID=382 RepID=UPI000B49AFE5|nr:hypothetical protein [Sinorhizobium meliloti]ASQ02365.1 hypothetical protein CDO24_34980 [Sinorhizobium meliloti]MDW9702780.1 hypothetical protein [Sinorhizobium meliloti]MDW9932942.1 hypothetical protein [Sinorhizobium meliloti]MDX0098721.1 hypothetical protein [Sinorhizobium meliloti]MDX0117372.1 hypothetical protein [Sinorhizobium meliloti]
MPTMIAKLGTLAVLGTLAPALGTAHDLSDIDLAIGGSSSWGRPAILIAWRNTNKVFEAEVLVQNLGRDPGKGRVFIEIVDPDGQVLMRRPEAGQEVEVSVNGKDSGGLEGELVQVMGSPQANQLIDRMDRDHIPYTIRAVIETAEGDIDRSNNVSGKTYNNEARVDKGSREQFSYRLSNSSEKPLSLLIEIDSAGFPEDWALETNPKTGEFINLAAGETVHGQLAISQAGSEFRQQRGTLVLRAIDVSTDRVFDVREWYVAADAIQPSLDDREQVIEVLNGSIHVEVVAHDPQSGIKEASGVRLEYSTDEGVTYSNKVMAYADGNFMDPTRFSTEIGPFVPGTKVQLSLSVSDSVGNILRRELGVKEVTGD